jgi:2-oxo-4-hydroxy-4-carboxy-5-ureidoimidazoline decarboxylase
MQACCAASEWARAMAAARPFASAEKLYAAAERAFASMDEDAVDEALAGHPRIGERPGGAGGAWSRQEQAGVETAGEATRAALAVGNAEYERRFGHVYLVSAAGRTAEELLAVLLGRLDNDRETERQVVRRELATITRLRLERVVGR